MDRTRTLILPACTGSAVNRTGGGLTAILNVAAAITCAVTDPRAANNVFNVGEAHTSTMGERLARLPYRPTISADEVGKNFEQNIIYARRRFDTNLDSSTR
jgi:hypothetical protein